MSGFLTSEMRFVGTLTPTNGATTLTFNAAGQQVALSQNTSWSVVYFQAHSHTAAAGTAFAVLTNLVDGSIYARINLTGMGSFAIDNNGRQVSPLIRPTNGSATLTVVVTSSSASEFYSAGANLEQVYGDPVA